MCANSEGSGETAWMLRLAWAFLGRLCDKYHNLMSWQYGNSYRKRAEKGDHLHWPVPEPPVPSESTIKANNYCNDLKLLDRWVRAKTVKTQITLLKEQSDQGLHCLPCHQHLLDSLLLYGRTGTVNWELNFIDHWVEPHCSTFRKIIAIFRVTEYLGILRKTKQNITVSVCPAWNNDLHCLQ